MPRSLFQNVSTIASATVASFTLTAAIADMPAQAISFTYTSTFDISAMCNAPNSVAKGSIQFIRSDLPSGQFRYTTQSFNTTFLGEAYDLPRLKQDPTPALLLNALLPTGYQAFIPAILNATDSSYVGGANDFPPPNFSNPFTNQKLANLPNLQSLFPSGGQISFSSRVERPLPQPLNGLGIPSETTRPLPDINPSPIIDTPIIDTPIIDTPIVDDGSSSAVPEPMTLVGAALAFGGAAIARHRQQNRHRQQKL